MTKLSKKWPILDTSNSLQIVKKKNIDFFFRAAGFCL